MQEFLTALRFVVFALFASALAVAVASWLVRTRRVSPFGPLGRGLKAVSDPVLKPVEARVFRAGGNPVNAGWWLVVGVAVVGVVGLALIEWLIRTTLVFGWAAQGGPRAVVATAVNLVYRILFLALFVRVIFSWFGVGRYNRWMRPVYWLTDWLVEPIRRVLPPFGMFDLSPLVALVVLWVLRALLLAVLRP